MARENLEDARPSVLDLRGASRLEASRWPKRSRASRVPHIGQWCTSAGHGDAHQRLPLRVEADCSASLKRPSTNVRKHAHAREVEIGLRRRGSMLTLSVGIDGRGFLPRRARSDGLSHGVVGMRERAKLLGGRLQISSGPGKGYTGSGAGAPHTGGEHQTVSPIR